MQDEIKKFEEKYDSIVKEVLVLTERGTSACKIGQEKMWEADVTILGMFSGDGKWNGSECLVHLDVDEEEAETAEDALSTWRRLLTDCAKWDAEARTYAAKELVDNANDWLYDSVEEGEEIEEITEEAFAQRLELSEVCVSTEGNFEIFYDDDDMFWGHVVIVSGDIEEGIDDATMAG